ncbi:hypothetical protein RI367_008224 [Sorochytrium milnesiophthora]
MNHLPAEIATHIAALCGVRVCAVLRYLPALQLILRAYKRGRNRSTAHEQTAIEVLLRHKWSAGVQAVLDAGIYRMLDCDEELWRGIKLTPASIRQLWRTPNIARHRLATVVYTLIEASEDGAEELLQWCASRSRLFCLHLGTELLRRGGSLDSLRSLCRKTGIYLDDRQLAQDFLNDAAAMGHVETVRYFAKISPELVIESSAPLESAAASGCLEIVQLLTEPALAARTQLRSLGHALFRAAAGNHLGAFQWLYERCPFAMPMHAITMLAHHGQLDILQRLWQDEAGLRCSNLLNQVTKGALEGNQTEVLAWLLEHQRQASVPGWEIELIYHNPTRVTASTAQWAAQHCGDHQVRRQFTLSAEKNQRTVVEWIVQNRPACSFPSAIDDAISRGHLELAEWLFMQLNDPLSPSTHRLPVEKTYWLAATGCLTELQWIDQHLGFDANQALLLQAIGSGHVDLVAWLLRTRPHLKIDENAFAYACQAGHLPMVQWAYPRWETLNKQCNALDIAAGTGCLELVQWLHFHTDLSCTTAAMDKAASMGRLDLLQFLHTHRSEGCSSQAMVDAAAGGHIDVLSWLRDNCAPECIPDTMHAAIDVGLPAVVRWLYQHYPHVVTSEAMDLAAGAGRLDIVQLLHAECGATCTTGAMDRAASAGHLDTIRWLHTHRSEGCTSDAMLDAVENDLLSIVRFLAESGYPICSPDVFCECSPYMMEGIGPRDNGEEI